MVFTINRGPHISCSVLAKNGLCFGVRYQGSLQIPRREFLHPKPEPESGSGASLSSEASTRSLNPAYSLNPPILSPAIKAQSPGAIATREMAQSPVTLAGSHAEAPSSGGGKRCLAARDIATQTIENNGHDPSHLETKGYEAGPFVWDFAPGTRKVRGRHL